MSDKKERIQTKVKMILSSFGNLRWDQIDLSEKIEDQYVSTAEKEYFVDEILYAYPNVSSTKFYNELFSDIETGNEVVDFILKYY